MTHRAIHLALVLCALWSPPLLARSAPGLQPVLARWDHDPHPDLRGVIVLHDGRIVAERYFNGETPDALHDVRSAGKSVTALLVGIAIDRGKLRGVDARVADVWPAARGRPVGETRVEDILTMRSGLAAFDEDPASPGNEDKLDAAPDPLAFLLALPRSDPPGSRYRYNSATAYTAGVLVAKATGGTMGAFARTALFEPLGIRRWTWMSDAAGYTKGQGNLSLTLRDFATIGEMVRLGGRYRGRRIVSTAWVRAALAPRVPISAGDPYADAYGYFWYSKTHTVRGKPVPVSFASGNGGNKIYVVPARHMVVAITSSAYGHGYGQRRSEDILKAILDADSAGAR